MYGLHRVFDLFFSGISNTLKLHGAETEMLNVLKPQLTQATVIFLFFYFGSNLCSLLTCNIRIGSDTVVIFKSHVRSVTCLSLANYKFKYESHQSKQLKSNIHFNTFENKYQFEIYFLCFNIRDLKHFLV